jgi:hypothetical protein
MFDGVLGNPPFIRYQYLPEGLQKHSELIFRQLSLPFTKHTNAWVPFVLASVALLKPGGRLGMVLPAELIHVTHAQALRTFLGLQCSRVTIIDPKDIWFENTLQGAIILLAEKKSHRDEFTDGLGIVKVSGRQFTQQRPKELIANTERLNGKTIEGKWTRALLSSKERSLLDAMRGDPHIFAFNKIATVDVGIVTGANKFFLVDDDTVKRYGLQAYSHPMFGRSSHCPGVIYDEMQHETNAENGYPTNLVWLRPDNAKLSKPVLKYIELGRSQNLHTRYKCRVRSPWYTVPSVYSTAIGMLKRAHDTPRLILNTLRAYTTDTAYRIESKGPAPEKLVYCFVNPLTALSAELEGRHYGGGVLELVPSEIERLIVPIAPVVRPALRALDKVVRKLAVADVLEMQSPKILGSIGVSKCDQHAVLEAWLRLRNRRQRNEVAAPILVDLN